MPKIFGIDPLINYNNQIPVCRTEYKILKTIEKQHLSSFLMPIFNLYCDQ